MNGLSFEQWKAVILIIGMMTAFLWGRFRYDLVALVTLLVAVASGVVLIKSMFIGFADDIVIIVGSALVVSAGIARSNAMDGVVRYLIPSGSSVRIKLAALVGIVALLSAVIKNIGALAIMMPIAFNVARQSKVKASVFLMPMAFASLLGGLMTMVGTSPNIVVARVREDITGEPFRMFDYTPIGILLVVAGLTFMVFFYWLVPERERADLAAKDAVEINDYLVEARVAANSSAVGISISRLRHDAGDDIVVVSILSGGKHVLRPLPDATLAEGDIVLLEGPADSIDRLVMMFGLDLTGQRSFASADWDEALQNVEAVVTEQSSLIGASAESARLFHSHGVNLLAVSRKNHRLDQSLGRVILQSGDVVLLQGYENFLPVFMRDMGVLPLAERPVLLGDVRNFVVPVVILAAAMVATAMALIPVTLAFFFAAAVAMAIFRIIPLRDIYHAIDAPILILLACLIPISQSLQSSGATDVMAAGLSQIGQGLPAIAAIAIIMVAAMLVTPFLNNAATVLIMAPIAASFASDLGYRPDAFLMAVALGAGCDFLTPIGHQCNTLVLGPGGYRFTDYMRLGFPLSVLVLCVSVPALAWIWL